MLKAFTVTFLASLSMIASAATYYKWIDPNGVPHYSQFAPTNGVDLKKVQVINTRELSSPATAATGSSAPAASTTMTPEQKRVAELEAQKKAADKAQIQERCKALQANLSNLNVGGRVYEMDDKGERKYLDGREIELKRQKVQQAINQYCK